MCAWARVSLGNCAHRIYRIRRARRTRRYHHRTYVRQRARSTHTQFDPAKNRSTAVIRSRSLARCLSLAHPVVCSLQNYVIAKRTQLANNASIRRLENRFFAWFPSIRFLYLQPSFHTQRHNSMALTPVPFTRTVGPLAIVARVRSWK